MSTTTLTPPVPVTRVPLPAVIAEVINAPTAGLTSGPVLTHGARLVRDVVDRLTAAGVTPPPAAVRALALDDEIAAALTPPPAAVDLLAERDLSDVDPADVAAWIVREARTSSAQTGAIAAAVAGQLLDRAVAALFDGFDDLVAGLRPQFDPAAAVLAEAAAAGIHSGMSADDVVDDDRLIAHWRALAPAVAVLDRIEDLWHRLALVAGVPLGTGERARRGRTAWLDASTAGPARLLSLTDHAAAHAPADGNQVAGAAWVHAGRTGHLRSGTAAAVQGEIIDGMTVAAEQRDQPRHDALRADIAAQTGRTDGRLERAASQPAAASTVGGVL